MPGKGRRSPRCTLRCRFMERFDGEILPSDVFRHANAAWRFSAQIFLCGGHNCAAWAQFCTASGASEPRACGFPSAYCAIDQPYVRSFGLMLHAVGCHVTRRAGGCSPSSLPSRRSACARACCSTARPAAARRTLEEPQWRLRVFASLSAVATVSIAADVDVVCPGDD